MLLFFFASGRLAQRESTAFTRRGSLVRTQYRPPDELTRQRAHPLAFFVSHAFPSSGWQHQHLANRKSSADVWSDDMFAASASSTSDSTTFWPLQCLENVVRSHVCEISSRNASSSSTFANHLPARQQTRRAARHASRRKKRPRTRAPKRRGRRSQKENEPRKTARRKCWLPG